MKTNNQKGFIVPLLLAIIAVLIIGGGAYIYTNKKVENNNYVTINSNLPAQSNQAATTTVKNTSNSTTSSYFEIKELGLKFKIGENLKDLVYIVKDNSPEGYGRNVIFSTKSLIAMGGVGCSPSEAPLGVLNVNNILREEGEIKAPFLIKEDNLYVSYVGPQAACSEVKSAQDLQNSQLTSLREALKTITAIKSSTTSSAQIYANGVSGPSQLIVNQTGTWVLDKMTPANSQLDAYIIDWGDVPISAFRSLTTNKATFTHSYNKSGTYIIKFWSYDGGVCDPAIGGPTIMPTDCMYKTTATVTVKNY